MSRRSKYIMFVSITLSLLLVITGILFMSNQGLAYQNLEVAEFTTTINSKIGDGSTPVPLEILGPAKAQVGDTVIFTVMGNDVADLAGFQLALQYDSSALGLAKATISDELLALGVDYLMMGPVHRDDTVYFGGAACPVADCASYDYQQKRLQPGKKTTKMPLVNFYFLVNSVGSYTLSMNSADLVGRDGAYLLTANQTPLKQPDSVSIDQLDLTRNYFVNDSDAWAAIGAWADLAEQGLCITAAIADYDINQSGCIDVADIQMILSHWGEPTSTFPNWVPAPGAVTDTTFIVTSAEDYPDSNPMDGICNTQIGECTLRAAIQESNVWPGRETINFDILNPGGVCPSLVVLQPATTLDIDDPAGDGVTIDGYTQCGAMPNTQPINGNAVIKIEIQGNQTAGLYGLRASSSNNIIKGFAVYDWNYQILLRGQRSQSNSIEGNFIGTNAANTHMSNFPGENDGMRIDNGASNNSVGGTGNAWEKRNLISGNDQDGLGLQYPETNNNVATGNYIGLKQDGVTSLRNLSDGIDIAGGTYDNRIGGLNPGDRNVISGNNGDGVEISHDSVTTNQVVGNFIGLNATGSQLTPNNKRGVTFEDITPQNKVFRNIIVGNGGYGVRFYTASDSELSDNFIGAYPPGLGPLDVVPLPGSISLSDLVQAPNGVENPVDGQSGVYMMGGSQNNLILRNIIAYHPHYGIHLSAEPGYLPNGSCETYYNTFSENSIFENADEGIKFSSLDCNGVVYDPNHNLPAPIIASANTSLVSGTACAGCTVEVFISDKTDVQDPNGDNNGEGKIYLASGTVDGGGNFSIPVTGVNIGQLVTATATNPAGDTSTFARNVLVEAGPSATLTPTLTPTNTPTSTPTHTPTSTPAPTHTPTSTPTSPPEVQSPYMINLPLVLRLVER